MGERHDIVKGAILIAVSLTVTGCSSGVLRPEDLGGHPSEVVWYDDLDLNDSASARILYERIESAAASVCGPARPLDAAQLWVRPCIRRAVAQAISRVNTPTLTSIHSRRTMQESKHVGC